MKSPGLKTIFLIFSDILVSIVLKVCVFDYKGNQVCREGGIYICCLCCRYVGPDDKTLPEGWGEMKYQDGSR